MSYYAKTADNPTFWLVKDDGEVEMMRSMDDVHRNGLKQVRVVTEDELNRLSAPEKKSILPKVKAEPKIEPDGEDE